MISSDKLDHLPVGSALQSADVRRVALAQSSRAASY